MDKNIEMKRKERIEAAYRSWRNEGMGILEASHFFTVEPEEIMDEFFRKEPFRAWWVKSKAEIAIFLASIFRRRHF